MRTRLKRTAIGVIAISLMALAGCGGSSDGASSGDGPSGTFTAKPKGGIPGALLPDELELWKYDASTSTYEVVDGDASMPYKVNLRKPSKPISIAYDDGYGGIPFTVQI